MFGKRSKPVRRLPPVPPVVDEAEVAESMTRLADAFVAGMATEGRRLTYDLADVRALDGVVDGFLADRPGYDVRRGFAFSLGAYLGELVVLRFRGRWVRDHESGQPGVVLPSGRTCLPMDQAARRIEIGVEHSLSAFYDGCADVLAEPERVTAI